MNNPTEQVMIERARCLQAVSDEPELVGDMPDEMWAAVQSCDREDMCELLRSVVRHTKDGIRARIRGESQ